ncbi:MAG: ribosomal-processing cysteine protease Prp [Defluviitaleaceae bacterium]|nr:ribosomal-processing cysteine protease Prp [Defluviitaleaceae bacterium]
MKENLNNNQKSENESQKIVEIDLYENGFKAYNHTDPIICAAISALSINTVNSIEALTNAKFTCEHNEEGGFLKFLLEDKNEKAKLLLESFKLGIKSIKENYPKQIKIEEY